MTTRGKIRIYKRQECIVFSKTKELFGGLSNMAAGYPLCIGGTPILTSEALYQACRFPHLPEVQELIIAQASPMTAKMKSKPYRRRSRPDWNRVRVRVMRWCLRVKLAQNWNKFRALLLETGDSPIVEESRRDDFWGAKPVDAQTLVGMNVLGRLLMELRECLKAEDSEALLCVKPLDILDFNLLGEPIPIIEGKSAGLVTSIRAKGVGGVVRVPLVEQGSLFDEPAAGEKATHGSHESRADTAVSGLTDLLPYPSYKPSGVEWLGEVPEHWEVRRLRQVASLLVSNVDKHTKAGEIPVRLCNYVDVYKNDRIDGHMPFMRATASEEEAKRFRLRRHDVAITKDSESWDDIGVPALIECEEPDLVYGYHLAILRPCPDRLSGSYLFRAFQAKGVTIQFHVAANGVTRFGLSQNAIKVVQIPIPPLPEQTAIARFLDYVDRKIRRFIHAKRKLIGLLEEQKQAVIHQAVTGAIDVRTGRPYPAYKPSGVEWLGEVPKHWSISRFARCVPRIDQGWSPVAAEGELEQHQWAVVTLSAVRRGAFDPTALKPISMGSSVPPRIELADGDLLITRSNTRELVGDVCIVRGVRPRTIFCDLIYRLLPRDDMVDREFLMHMLLSRVGRDQIEQDARGSSGTMPKISKQRMRTWQIPLPSLSEQKVIVGWIEELNKRINGSIRATRREIKLLEEYRTRLIADVVTGKLDVREVAARLPDDEEETEPDDASAEEGSNIPGAEAEPEAENASV